MMKQTPLSLAICLKLLMTVIMIFSDISVMLIYWMWYTGSCHCPCDERSGMVSSFTGRGGCPLVQISWRLDGQPAGISMTQARYNTCTHKQEKPLHIMAYDRLSSQCHPHTWISTFTYKQGPSNIPTLKYYWEMKEVIICPCIESVLLGRMDVISCWCRAKAMRPIIAVTKNTQFLNVLPLHSQRCLLQSIHQERGRGRRAR